MRDLTQAVNYIPNVTRIVINTKHKEGVGTQRMAFSRTYPGWTHETVTRWDEEVGFTLRLHRGRRRTFFWFNEICFNYLIKAHEEKTMFEPSIDFIPRFNFITKLAEKKLYRELKVICMAMKAYYETSIPVSPRQIEALKAKLDIDADNLI